MTSFCVDTKVTRIFAILSTNPTLDVVLYRKLQAAFAFVVRHHQLPLFRTFLLGKDDTDMALLAFSAVHILVGLTLYKRILDVTEMEMPTICRSM